MNAVHSRTRCCRNPVSAHPPDSFCTGYRLLFSRFRVLPSTCAEGRFWAHARRIVSIRSACFSAGLVAISRLCEGTALDLASRGRPPAPANLHGSLIAAECAWNCAHIDIDPDWSSHTSSLGLLHASWLLALSPLAFSEPYGGAIRCRTGAILRSAPAP